MFPVEEQDKTPERSPMEMEINDLPDKEFKVIVTHMLLKFGGEWGNRMRCQQGLRKQEKKPVRAEKYKNGNKKYTIGNIK